MRNVGNQKCYLPIKKLWQQLTSSLAFFFFFGWVKSEWQLREPLPSWVCNIYKHRDLIGFPRFTVTIITFLFTHGKRNNSQVTFKLNIFKLCYNFQYVLIWRALSTGENKINNFLFSENLREGFALLYSRKKGK